MNPSAGQWFVQFRSGRRVETMTLFEMNEEQAKGTRIAYEPEFVEMRDRLLG